MSSRSFEQLLSSLNPQQKQAVLHTSGPLLVIAGAGSGKTRVITARIMNLIREHGVDPSEIVALTFTNKAGDEMRQRIRRYLGPDQRVPFVGTFHAYCVQLIKRHSAVLNLSSFTIMDGDDQRKVVQTILKRANLTKRLTPRIALYHIGQVKQQQWNLTTDITFDHPLMHDIFFAYEKEKKESNCLDFDDLLIQARKLFDHPGVKGFHQQRVRHILVDEYQDTNRIQHELLKQMTCAVDGTVQQLRPELAIDSLCVVGDEDQSIYSWRGATVANMLRFGNDFAGTRTLKIEQNYRSVQPILDVANDVIQNNTQRTHKALWSEKTAKSCVHRLSCLSEYTESNAVAQLVLQLRKKEENPSVAVLYRTHVQSRALEEALLKHSIPYKIVGGIQFYERKEIKDILAYLRLIKNPFDRPSFFRIMNVPARGLGEKFEELFHERWQQEPFLTFDQVAQKLIDQKIVKGVKKQSLDQVRAIFGGLKSTDSVVRVIELIVERVGYTAYLKDIYEPDEVQERINNIKELLDAAAHFEQRGIGSVDQFLDEVALLQDLIHAAEDEQAVVYLMTLHAVKGLEFDTVVITGLEEAILPSARSLQSDIALEEERRLFYVGITRARERLMITHCKFRYSYGQMSEQIQSRFVDELPNRIPHTDTTYWKKHEQDQFFTQWIADRDSQAKIGGKSREADAVGASRAFRRSRTAQHDALIQQPSGRQELSPAPTLKKLQPVRHQTYGVGIVQKVEKRANGTEYVSVKFKEGLKKIVSRFLQAV